MREHDGVQQLATMVDANTDIDKVTLEFMNVYAFNTEDEDSDQLWTFKEILGHIKQGRSYEMQILWDIGENTWEPLTDMNLSYFMGVE